MRNFPQKWRCRKVTDIDFEVCSRFNFSPALITLFANRGIKTEEQILSFLKPSFRDLHDPGLLPGIKEGISRVKRAIYTKERILVFGDYDTDGIISCVIMYNFLKRLGVDVDIYVPDRFTEGYDISINFVKRILNENLYKLIICVDCGTNSSEVQEYVCKNNIDIDIIACDHHEPHSTPFPEGIHDKGKYIIINPKLEYSTYPFKDLSGAGVTFKFITAVLRELEEEFKKRFEKSYLTSLLDMVAISTIADVMPLVGENRVIVKKGLEILKNSSNRGLKRMLDRILNGVEEITPDHVGFVIAPRLNAEGRVKNAENSIKLLKEDEKEDEVSLGKIVDELNLSNEKRKSIQESVLNEIIANNDFSWIIENQKIFIDKSERWSEGVLGIVASDLVKRFNIPVILFREKGEKLKGSGRSIEKFNLYENLFSLRDLFEKFGGHELACGITMPKSNFEYFKDEMIRIASSKLSSKDVEKSFSYDLEMSFKDINGNFIRELQLLKPFGVGNPRPVFVTRNCEILSKTYSQDEKVLKIRLKNSNVVFSGIMFGVENDLASKVLSSGKVNVLYTIDETCYKLDNKITMTQLVILDLELCL